MIDYSLPVARRTRQGRNAALVDYHVSKKRKNEERLSKSMSSSEGFQSKGSETSTSLFSNSRSIRNSSMQYALSDSSISPDDDDDDDDDDDEEEEESKSDPDEEFSDHNVEMKSTEVELETDEEDDGIKIIEEDVVPTKTKNEQTTKTKNEQKGKRKRKRKKVVSESEEDDGVKLVGDDFVTEDCVDLTLMDSDDEVDRVSSKGRKKKEAKRKKPDDRNRKPPRKKPDDRNQKPRRNSVARQRLNLDSDDAKKKTSHRTIHRPHSIYNKRQSGDGDKDKQSAAKTMSQSKSGVGDKDEQCATKTKAETEKIGSKNVGVGDKDEQCATKTKSETEKIGSKNVEGNEKEFVNVKKKNVRKRAPISQRVLEILADSLLDGASEMRFEEISPEAKTDHPTIDEEVIQYKFYFVEEEQIVSRKSNAEKEIEDLFADMDYALQCSEIGSADPTMLEDDNQAFLPDEHDRSHFCRHGKHELKLDEEIGLVCKFCGHVELEIRYIVPAFGSNSRKRTDYIYEGREEKSLFEDFVNQLPQGLCIEPEPINNFNYEEGTVWELIPGTKQSMYPHQREGFEFIWNNVAGGLHLEKIKNPETENHGSGCIISHVPGTGKTRLTLVFLQSYMKLFNKSRPVIVAPRSMLLTWEEEFKKWKVNIPFHILNIPELSGNESKAATNLYKRSKDPRLVRLMKLFSWKNKQSVLGISYGLFEKLAGDDSKKVLKGLYEHEIVKTLLLDTSDIFIFDEGHTPRNEKSRMFRALHQIKTEKRIILSGTPFQNNFVELYNTLCLVRPSFADKMEAKNGGVQKKRGPKASESKQKWISLTDTIGQSGCQLQDASIEELRATIAPFVHIHKGNILKQTLHGLRHSVLILQPGNTQKSLLDAVQGPRYVLKDDCAMSLLSVHPSLLPESINNKQALVDRYKLQDLRLKPEAGVKTWFLMELLRLSMALKEKVLVFGQYIEALTYIKDQLKFQHKWKEGREILHMDGRSDPRKRQTHINLFNDPKSEARIMLASTKACGEGINLIGASRVVLLDVLWNPSVERQAISRAYRIGQKKTVYVYRLITSGTMEEGKWNRQAEKDRLSELVFRSPSELGVGNQERETTSCLWKDDILEEMVKHERNEKMFKQIIYQKQPNETDFLESSD